MLRIHLDRSCCCDSLARFGPLRLDSFADEDLGEKMASDAVFSVEPRCRFSAPLATAIVVWLHRESKWAPGSVVPMHQYPVSDAILIAEALRDAFFRPLSLASPVPYFGARLSSQPNALSRHP